MTKPVQPKRSFTANRVPLASELEVAELSINWADKALYTLAPTGEIVGIVAGERAPAGLQWSAVPVSPTAPAAAGEIAYNGEHLFVAVAANTWKRLALTDWVVSSITITQQPADQTASGGAATFTVAATVTGGGAVTYQWQSSLDAGSTWSNISGATTDTLSLTGLQISDDGSQYRAVVSATGTASVPTAAATLTVTVSPSGDNLQAESGDILQTEAGEWLQHDGIDATPPAGDVWEQRGEIVTSGDTSLDDFGYVVRATPNGNTMLTGTIDATTSAGYPAHVIGLVRILDWNNNAWIKRGDDITGNVTEQGIKYQLFPSGFDTCGIDALGTIVAVSGEKYDTNIQNLQSSDVSAWVRTYSWSGIAWVQRGQDIAHAHRSGTIFALSDDGLHIACGIPGSATDAGEVKTYRWDGATWSLSQTLTGDVAELNFGSAVAIGNAAKRLAVASKSAVRIYERPTTESLWSLTQTILTEGVQGNNEQAPYVRQVKLSGTDASVCVIATPYETVNTTLNVGRVKVYDYVGGIYTQRGDAVDGAAYYDSFGYNVAISENGLRLIVARPGNWQNFGPAGSVEVFAWENGQWTNKSSITGLEEADAFGASMDASADGSIVMIGAPFANTDNGYVRVMQLQIP